MWMVVGLGNPGPAYANTRHNVGFMVTELLARRWRIAFESAPELRVGCGQIAGRPVALLQPQTYMNRSGEALAEMGHASDAQLVAVYDDLDLPVGALRVRTRGGSGGHRGVASMAAHFGADFIRVRVGIGRPPTAVDVADYVLGVPDEVERIALDAAVASAADAVECLLAEGTTAAMNRFNGRGAAER